MKAKHLFLGIILVATSIFLFSSCDDCIKGDGKIITKYIKVGDVSIIKLFGDANIILIPDSTDSIKIVGESNVLEAYEFKESGKTLKIKSDRCIFSHETVNITIPVRLVEELALNGSGNFTSTGPLRAMDLELALNGSGNFDLNVQADNVFSKINGSGNVTLKGSTKNQRTTINGSGNLEALECPTGSVSITINGSGDCKVMATSALKVVIRGSGNVYYKGTPDVSTEVKGSGGVEKLN
jgi:hypothetical protein